MNNGILQMVLSVRFLVSIYVSANYTEGSQTWQCISLKLRRIIMFVYLSRLCTTLALCKHLTLSFIGIPKRCWMFAAVAINSVTYRKKGDLTYMAMAADKRVLFLLTPVVKITPGHVCRYFQTSNTVAHDFSNYARIDRISTWTVEHIDQGSVITNYHLPSHHWLLDVMSTARHGYKFSRDSLFLLEDFSNQGSTNGSPDSEMRCRCCRRLKRIPNQIDSTYLDSYSLVSMWVFGVELCLICTGHPKRRNENLIIA